MVTATVMSSRHCEGAADLLSREWPKRSRTARCREFRKDVSGTDDRVHLVLLDEDEQVVVRLFVVVSVSLR